MSIKNTAVWATLAALLGSGCGEEPYTTPKYTPPKPTADNRELPLRVDPNRPAPYLPVEVDPSRLYIRLEGTLRDKVMAVATIAERSANNEPVSPSEQALLDDALSDLNMSIKNASSYLGWPPLVSVTVAQLARIAREVTKLHGPGASGIRIPTKDDIAQARCVIVTDPAFEELKALPLVPFVFGINPLPTSEDTKFGGLGAMRAVAEAFGDGECVAQPANNEQISQMIDYRAMLATNLALTRISGYQHTATFLKKTLILGAISSSEYRRQRAILPILVALSCPTPNSDGSQAACFIQDFNPAPPNAKNADRLALYADAVSLLNGYIDLQLADYPELKNDDAARRGQLLVWRNSVGPYDEEVDTTMAKAVQIADLMLATAETSVNWGLDARLPVLITPPIETSAACALMARYINGGKNCPTSP